jgi:hypothetical protein
LGVGWTDGGLGERWDGILRLSTPYEKMGWENKVDLALALEMKEIICGFNEQAGDIAWIRRIQRDWVIDPSKS